MDGLNPAELLTSDRLSTVSREEKVYRSKSKKYKNGLFYDASAHTGIVSVSHPAAVMPSMSFSP